MHYVFASIEFGGYGGIVLDDVKGLTVITGEQLTSVFDYFDNDDNANDFGDLNKTNAALGFQVGDAIQAALEMEPDTFKQNLGSLNTKRSGTMVEFYSTEDGVIAAFRFPKKPTKAQLKTCGTRTSKWLAKMEGEDYGDGWD